MKNCFQKHLLAIGMFSLSLISYAQTIAAGGGVHSLAICNTNLVSAWGQNVNGELGNNSNSPSNSPVTVNSITGVVAVSGGGAHSLALKNDGTVWGWGSNTFGQLGDSTINDSNVPVQAWGLTGIIAISAGNAHSMALKNDGTIWVWGNNVAGCLGLGVNIPWSIYPVQITSVSGIIAISAGGGGSAHSLALKNDGTVWAWGDDSNGELGDGFQNDRNYPLQVNGISSIADIASGSHHCLALKNDGTLWTWGLNGSGQLGIGSANSVSLVPVQITAFNNVKSMSGGYYHSLAVKSDGTVWSWGQNVYGQLGNGTTVASNVPVQITSLSNVHAAAAGFKHSMVLKNDGTLWVFGDNVGGELGNGTFNSDSIPLHLIGLCPVYIGINDISQANKSITVYPNPSSSLVNVQLNENNFVSGKNYSVELYDVMGNLVRSESKSPLNNSIEIEKENLAPGIYYFSLGNGETIVGRGKIIFE